MSTANRSWRKCADCRLGRGGEVDELWNLREELGVEYNRVSMVSSSNAVRREANRVLVSVRELIESVESDAAQNEWTDRRDSYLAHRQAFFKHAQDELEIAGWGAPEPD